VATFLPAAGAGAIALARTDRAARAIARSGRTEDFGAGVTAFAQKKTSTFKGR